MKNLGVILQLIMLVVSWFAESNKEAKAKKKKALEEVINGIENEDASAITSGFDSLNRS